MTRLPDEDQDRDRETRDGGLNQGSSNAPGLRGGKSSDPYMQGRRDAMTEFHRSGGLAESQLGLEVLFMLPDKFVLAYEKLWATTFPGVGHGPGMGTRQEAIEKAKGTTGTVLGSATRAQASGTGKKFKPPAVVLGKDEAVRLKGRVDRGLERVAEDFMRELTGYLRSGGGQGSKAGDSSGGGKTKAGALTGRPVNCRGRIPGRNGVTRGCGRFLQPGWDFCPWCGTEKNERE